MPKYILDSNIFITSHQRQYGMGFCPGFWDWLVVANSAGKVFSIDRVCSELQKIEDSLCEWAKARGEGFFLPLDQPAVDKMTDVTSWTHQQSRFTEAAKQEFFGCADVFLVAYSLAHGCTLVTHEGSAPGSRRKVFIPDVCVGLGVQCMTLWDVLRAENPRFVLET